MTHTPRRRTYVKGTKVTLSASDNFRALATQSGKLGAVVNTDRLDPEALHVCAWSSPIRARPEPGQSNGVVKGKVKKKSQLRVESVWLIALKDCSVPRCVRLVNMSDTFLDNTTARRCQVTDVDRLEHADANALAMALKTGALLCAS